jgi:hypothetical protein
MHMGLGWVGMDDVYLVLRGLPSWLCVLPNMIAAPKTLHG